MKISIKKIGVLAVLVLITISAVVFLANKWRNDDRFDKITIEGNYTIAREDILAVARLKDDSSVSMEELNIDLIQDRIALHPEVKRVYVSKEPPAELRIQIIEKNPIAILNIGDEMKLVDDELEIFPFNNYEKMFDLPVISGLKVKPTKIEPNKLDEEDLRIAAFIITNARKEGKSLHYQISEVNMSDPDKIIIYSNEKAVPFYFPRGKGKSIADVEYQSILKNKLDVFQEFCDKILGSETDAMYVDLRFSNQVVVNFKRNLTQESESSEEEENESQKKKSKSKAADTNDIIVGLDVGTTKICVIVARAGRDNKLDILGIGIAPSDGLHRGIVVNPHKTIDSIQKALKEAELNSGVEIESVTVGIAGHHIRCIQSSSTVGINNSDRVIQEEDIQRLVEQARIMKLPSDTKIIDVIPQEYIIDGKDGIFETPVGMFGVRLEAKVNIITGLVSSIDDLSKCVTSCGVNIDDIVLEPIASSYSVLDETEKKVGVAMIDIGGGTTDIAVFKKGVLKYTAGIGIAGNLVTNDIIEALGIAENEAERIKREYGYASVGEILNDETITVEAIKGKIPKKTKKSILARIIQARMQDIFELAAIEIQNSMIASELHAGVVVTGGGSLVKGTKELAEGIMGTDVNLGIPTGLTGGLIKEVESPIFATGVGLVLYRYKSLHDTDKPVFEKASDSGDRKKKNVNMKNIFSKIKEWFDEL